MNPERNTWSGMIQRCCNPKNPSYHRYGGRGISVCDEWRSFHAFYRDMGPKPTLKHSIDRIDNDGNYEPGNCRWATAREQALNRRKPRKHYDVLTFHGVSMTLPEWSEKFGIPEARLRERLKSGFFLDLALHGGPLLGIRGIEDIVRQIVLKRFHKLILNGGSK